MEWNHHTHTPNDYMNRCTTTVERIRALKAEAPDITDYTTNPELFDHAERFVAYIFQRCATLPDPEITPLTTSVHVMWTYKNADGEEEFFNIAVREVDGAGVLYLPSEGKQYGLESPEVVEIMGRYTFIV